MARRRALVIGSQCAALPGLSFLPQVAEELAGVLGAPELGGCSPALPDGRMLLVEPTVEEADQAIETAIARASEARDTLLVVFVGHGEHVEDDFYLLLRRHFTPSDRLEPVEADDCTGQQHEREPPPRIPIPAHLQPPPAAQPRQRPFHPPSVPSQPGRRLDPTPRDPRSDPTTPQPGTVGLAVIALVRMDLGGSDAPPPRRPADWRDVIQDGLKHRGVVDVGGGDRGGQRQPAAVADQVELAPRLATIDGICAHMVPPRLARTLMVSTLARVQSSRPCSPRRSKTTRCSWSNTPALAHSVRRRQQVEGEPQPSSRAGSSRQGVEVRAMNTIAAKQARLGMARCRPPYGGRGGAGSRGSTSAHSSSGTRSSARVVMPQEHASAA
jgi:hypothetical protein